MENGTWTQYQKLVLKLLEQHDEKLEILVNQLREDEADRAGIHNSIDSLKEDLDKVEKLLSSLEESSSKQQRQLERLEHEANLSRLHQKEQADEKKELKKYKQGFLVAIAGSAITVIWEIAKHFLF